METTDQQPAAQSAWWILPSVYLMLVCGFMHFGNVFLLGYDSYFHARYSSTLPGKLFARELPAAAFSVWSDTWGDKEFLFHLALMPFVQIESLIVEGTKFAGFVFNMAFLASLVFVMRGQRIRTPILWIALLLIISGSWWVRFSTVRGQLGALIFFPWILYLFERRKLWPLAITVFFFTWSYTAPYFAAILVTCMAVARLLTRATIPGVERSSEGPSDLRLLVYTIAATVLGMCIHPHTPNVQITTWIHLRFVLARAWGLDNDSGINLAGEFVGPNWRQSLIGSPALYLILASAWGLALTGRKTITERGGTMLLMTIPIFCLYALSQRFIEYLAPMSLWALGAVATDRLAGRRVAEAIPSKEIRYAGVGILCVLALFLHARVMRYAYDTVTNPIWSLNQQGAGKWLKENAPPGSLAIPLAWGQTPQLYFHAPDVRYQVLLDPMLMYVRYPEEARFMNDLLFRKIPFSLQIISEQFPTADYFVASATQGADFKAMDATGAVPVFDDGNTRVYELPKQ